MAFRLIIQRRLPQLGGGRFASECPAGLNRNGWPVCVGIRKKTRRSNKEFFQQQAKSK
jgi:hypothetical protein